MEKDELQQAVSSLSWFHQIHLGHGVVTPGRDPSREKFEALHLPADLTGLTVLDIGALNGYFSFECENRGASVTAADHFCWGGSHINMKDCFDFAKGVLQSKVDERFIPVEQMNAESMGTFDIVLFLGVLYHSPDPLGYLRNVRSMTKGFAVIETHVDLVDLDRPALAYYPGGALGGDASNYFGPNEHAVVGMCQDAGFSRTEVVDRFWVPHRMVFHAYP